MRATLDSDLTEWFQWDVSNGTGQMRTHMHTENRSVSESKVVWLRQREDNGMQYVK
jgi:hypothetical protein